MTEKNLNTRIINKHDTEENWLKATNFIPKAGEMIIYDADANNPLPRMKIGNGVSYVGDLEFVGIDSPAIIDVVALPEGDIDDNSFYRVTEAIFFRHWRPESGYTCIVVEQLPEVGESATDSSFSQLTFYYCNRDDAAYGYVPADVGAMFGAPEGWYPAADVLRILNRGYGGIVHTLKEMQATPEWLWLYVRRDLYSYSGGTWTKHYNIGTRETETGGECFNIDINVALGMFSHAEGYNSTASGDYSHVEGSNSTASGGCSHAEGYNSTASGDYSHAEGSNSTASGDYSHAEGRKTTANGDYSHVEGYETIAWGDYSHVEGKYNIENGGTYAHIVGNGRTVEGGISRSNAHTLDWDGNAWFAGDVYVGSTSGTNKDEGSQKLITMTELQAAIPEIEAITTDEIDTICGTVLYAASEVLL